MSRTIGIDPNTGEEFLILTGCSRIVSVEGVGPAIGDAWAHYLVEFERGQSTSHDGAGAIPSRPVVAARDPLLLAALDGVTSPEPVEWVVEGRRLPHIPATTPYAGLDEVGDVSFHLSGLGGLAAVPG